MKSLAQLFDQISIREGVLVIWRHDHPERELTIVPSTQVEHIIRLYHDGPEGARQSPKATSAKIISCFKWPDLKRNVRLYVACCRLRAVHSIQPNPESGPQVDGGWRSRRLPSYGHSQRHGFPCANPERQSLHTNPHRLLHALRSSSTSRRSICRGCHCISNRSLYYGVRYPAPYTNRTRL